MTENLVTEVASAEPVATTEPAVNNDAMASSESAATAESQAQVIEQPVAEKMLSQSEVNRIVAGRLKEQERRIQQQYAQQQPVTQQPAQTMGGINQPSQSDLQQMIRQEAMNMARMEQANKVAQSYTQKINSEMNSDPEFAELYSELNIESHPDMVFLVNDLDNTAAVVKDMAKNPSKFAQVMMLSRGGNQQLAFKELKKLSDSIKANEIAKKQTIPAAPLSQMKPSHLSAGDGKLTVKDFKANPKFRG